MISEVSVVVVAWMSSVGGSPMEATLSTPPMRGVSWACARAATPTTVKSATATAEWSLMALSSRAQVARSARILEASDRLRKQLLGQPQHDIRKEHGEADGREEDDVERQRASHGPAEVDTHELRGHQERQPVGRRDQPEDQRRDDDHAHVHGVDVAELAQLQNDRHEDDDRWDSVDEVADDDEQRDQQEHD